MLQRWHDRLGSLRERASESLGIIRKGRIMALRLAFASDHAAVAMKAALVDHARSLGHEVTDLGPETEASVDYPDYGYALAEAVAEGRADRGIALCGSGIGISIAVNRHPDVRCALVSEPLSARLAREHNDANVDRDGRAPDRHRAWPRPASKPSSPPNSAAAATSAASTSSPIPASPRSPHEHPAHPDRRHPRRGLLHARPRRSRPRGVRRRRP